MARSRYGRTKIVDGNSFETFSLKQSNSIKEPDTFDNMSFITYIVKQGDRLDHLAARFLNDDRYYWVIALVNNLTLPIVTPGQKIIIPADIKEVLDRI